MIILYRNIIEKIHNAGDIILEKSGNASRETGFYLLALPYVTATVNNAKDVENMW